MSADTSATIYRTHLVAPTYIHELYIGMCPRLQCHSPTGVRVLALYKTLLVEDEGCSEWDSWGLMAGRNIVQDFLAHVVLNSN